MFRSTVPWLKGLATIALALLLSGVTLTRPTLSQFEQLLFLPMTVRRWPPVPDAPALNAIDNSDLDNVVTLTWTPPEDAGWYWVQESTDPAFANAAGYQNVSSLGYTIPNKIPGTYYYRVASVNAYGQGPWSNVQSVNIYPLFVGLQVRWDGAGYIRTNETYDVGIHETNALDLVTDVGILRLSAHQWYDPDPQGWGSDTWTTYYRASTGEYQSSSSPGNSDWKWGYGWYTAYGSEFSGGQATVGGQPFHVTGPHPSVTAFGVSFSYWEMTNAGSIVIWDGGQGWTQVLEPNTVVLRYDAGPSRLLVYSDLLRRYYQNGGATPNTVRYTENLTAASFFNGSIGNVMLDMNDHVASLPTLLDQGKPGNPRNIEESPHYTAPTR